jgi:hypothetical protein
MCNCENDNETAANNGFQHHRESSDAVDAGEKE